MISLSYCLRSNTSLNVASDIITANNHGMVVNNAIRFLSIVTTTGIATGTTYYVANTASFTPNTFQITDTLGGVSVINLTGSDGKANLEVLFPVAVTTSIKTTSIKNVLTNVKFSPIKILAITKSNAIKITGIISEFVQFSPVKILNTVYAKLPIWKELNLIGIKFSPINILAITKANTIRITNITPKLVQFSPVGVLTSISLSIDNISNVLKFSPVGVLTSISLSIDNISNILKFSPVIISNNITAITNIPSAVIRFTKISFAKIVKIGSGKLPDPKTTWSQVTEITTKIKTLIEFWS